MPGFPTGIPRNAVNQPGGVAGLDESGDLPVNAITHRVDDIATIGGVVVPAGQVWFGTDTGDVVKVVAGDGVQTFSESVDIRTPPAGEVHVRDVFGAVTVFPAADSGQAPDHDQSRLARGDALTAAVAFAETLTGRVVIALGPGVYYVRNITFSGEMVVVGTGSPFGDEPDTVIQTIGTAANSTRIDVAGSPSFANLKMWSHPEMGGVTSFITMRSANDGDSPKFINCVLEAPPFYSPSEIDPYAFLSATGTGTRTITLIGSKIRGGHTLFFVGADTTLNVRVERSRIIPGGGLHESDDFSSPGDPVYGDRYATVGSNAEFNIERLDPWPIKQDIPLARFNAKQANDYTATFMLVNGHPVLSFANGNDDEAIFGGTIAPTYSGGDIDVMIRWAPDANAASNEDNWSVSVERVNDSADIMTDNFAAAVSVGTAAPSAGELRTTTVRLTGASLAGLEAGDDFRLKLERLHDEDNASDWRVLSITLMEVV